MAEAPKKKSFKDAANLLATTSSVSVSVADRRSPSPTASGRRDRRGSFRAVVKAAGVVTRLKRRSLESEEAVGAVFETRASERRTSCSHSCKHRGSQDGTGLKVILGRYPTRELPVESSETDDSSTDTKRRLGPLRQLKRPPAERGALPRDVAWGSLTFPQNGSRRAKWAAVGNHSRIADVTELLTKSWSLPWPTVLFSITGGATEITELQSDAREAFQLGLLGAVRATNAWVITGGTDCGKKAQPQPTTDPFVPGETVAFASLLR
jgi:hypothetical protein